jgi:hypothetical protein
MPRLLLLDSAEADFTLNFGPFHGRSDPAV